MENDFSPNFFEMNFRMCWSKGFSFRVCALFLVRSSNEKVFLGTIFKGEENLRISQLNAFLILNEAKNGMSGVNFSTFL